MVCLFLKITKQFNILDNDTYSSALQMDSQSSVA